MAAIRPTLVGLLLVTAAAVRFSDDDNYLQSGWECSAACDCEHMDFPKFGFERECSACLSKLGMQINNINVLMDVRSSHCAPKAVVTEVTSSSTSAIPVTDADARRPSPWGPVAVPEPQRAGAPAHLSLVECYVTCDCEHMDYPNFGFERECSACLIKLGMQIDKRNPLMDVRSSHCGERTSSSTTTGATATTSLSTTSSSVVAAAENPSTPTTTPVTTATTSSSATSSSSVVAGENPSTPTSDSPAVNDVGKDVSPGTISTSSSPTTTVPNSGRRRVFFSATAMVVTLISIVVAN
mmetsp:Transcript_135569/g.289947  ORF Transcript_135569/g.289947 Transcript_135569/m.289947 type:complete len:296 (-) Transcript_135569:59-946(-)